MTGSAHGPVIAHRGYSSQAPENTRAAFEAGIIAGCDMIELDARLTGDGQVVVLHDAELERYGHAGNAGSMSLAEITALDAGSWFESRFADECFLGLTDALNHIAGRVPVNVELKLDHEDGEAATRLVAAVMQAVAAATPTPGPADLLYSTFSAAVFGELRRQASAVPAALLVGHRLGQLRVLGRPRTRPLFKRVSYLLANVIPELVDQGAEGLHVHRSLAGPEVIAGAHEAGLALRVFTVNDRVGSRRLLAEACDGIFTDQVEQLVQVVRELGR
jgi:glycerophosphoryl diester phosphodiesterase